MNNRLVFDDYLVDSSSVLSLYGLREARDIDYLSNVEPLPKSDVYDLHNSYIRYYGCDLDELIDNPKNYFYFFGVKYVSLNRLRIMKKNRGEQKDKVDLRLINSLNKKRMKNEISLLKNKIKYKIKQLLS